MMKRYRLRSASQKKAAGVPIKNLFEQPEDDFYRMPELQIRGGCILTDGCRRVLDFSPEKLCLDMGHFVITFYGAQLRIESLSGRRLSVAGKVYRIEFARKWEGQNGSA